MLDSTRTSSLYPNAFNGQRPTRDNFSLAALQQVPLFKGLRPKDMKTVVGLIKKRALVPDEQLVAEDATDNSLYFILSGAFKITVRKGEGTVLLGLCGRGELLGELAAIDGQARSATVTAQTPCLVGVLAARHFWDEVWPLSPIPLNMAHFLAGRVRRLTGKVQAMATLDVRGRLAFQIATLARDHGILQIDGSLLIPFGLTQAELAQMVGTSRVQVNQLMTSWTKHDILTAKRNSITVQNLELLGQMYPTSLEVSLPGTIAS